MLTSAFAVTFFVQNHRFSSYKMFSYPFFYGAVHFLIGQGIEWLEFLLDDMKQPIDDAMRIDKTLKKNSVDEAFNMKPFFL